jgi:hypothetical protein
VQAAEIRRQETSSLKSNIPRMRMVLGSPSIPTPETLLYNIHDFYTTSTCKIASFSDTRFDGQGCIHK